MSDDCLAEISEILPRRVNDIAVVYFGCTNKELIGIFGGAFAFWFAVALFGGITTDYFILFLGASLLLTLGSGYGIARGFQAVKAGKPAGYHSQKWSIFCEKCGVGKSHLFTGDGPLEIGRSKQYINPRRLVRQPTDPRAGREHD